jgi:hypothetical protein
MGRVIDELGIYGYRLDDENRIIAGLLTGDPQLFVGRHGAAKTMLAEELANALFYEQYEAGASVPFVPYDASKVSFEDVLGFPNPKDLRQGKMSFVNGPVTIWDKEFVFLDEINRAEADMQSKLLELIRSKRVMGYPTNVKFVWAAMNPKGYEGANDLDEALVGRFGNFVYVPDVLDLSDGLRAKVAARVGKDDSPAIRYWLGHADGQTEQGKVTSVQTYVDYGAVGRSLRNLQEKAAHQYMILAQDALNRGADRIALWVSYFANVLKTQSKPADGAEGEPILLDGRRLGMIRRQILAVRAIHVVRANLFHEPLPDMKRAAELAVKGSIPTGINVEGGVDTDALAIIDKAFRTLEAEFDKDKDERLFKIIYTLTSETDLTKRVRILLSEPLDEITRNSEWSRICGEEHSLDLSVLCFLAQMIESKHKGTIPANVLSQLAQNVDESVLNPAIAPLAEQHMEFADRLTEIVEQWKGEGELPQRLMSIAKVNDFIRETTESGKSNITETQVKRLEKEVSTSCDELSDLIRLGVAA